MSIRVELLHSNAMYKVIILEDEFKVNVLTDSLGYESIAIYKNDIPLDIISFEFQTVLKTFNALKKESIWRGQ